MNHIADMLNDPDFVTEFIFGIAGGTRTAKGDWIESIDEDKKEAIIQPASKSDTKHLTDGDESRQAINIWSADYMSAVDKVCPQKGDIIGWHDRSYRIVSVDDWSQYGFWYAMAVQLLGGEHE